MWINRGGEEEEEEEEEEEFYSTASAAGPFLIYQTLLSSHEICFFASNKIRWNFLLYFGF
ncbi:MAG TPA: hypothetical protein VHF65_03335 [Nitrososphaera sp.]|nr:hypothetical protein [Nitrososphaera sp.]